VVRRSAAVRACLSALVGAAPTLVFAATLLVHSSRLGLGPGGGGVGIGGSRGGGGLRPSTVFGSLSLFHQLRFPLLFFPVVLNQLADAKVSLARIAAFLAADDAHAPAATSMAGQAAMVATPLLDAGDVAAADSTCASGAVVLGAGAYFWADPGASMTQPALWLEAPLVLPRGTLACVVGPVGVGKTAALLAFLGQMHQAPPLPLSKEKDVDSFNQAYRKAAGAEIHETAAAAAAAEVATTSTAAVPGSVAYCAQGAWLPSSTVREAVTFGRPWDPAWY